MKGKGYFKKATSSLQLMEYVALFTKFLPRVQCPGGIFRLKFRINFMISLFMEMDLIDNSYPFFSFNGCKEEHKRDFMQLIANFLTETFRNFLQSCPEQEPDLNFQCRCKSTNFTKISCVTTLAAFTNEELRLKAQNKSISKECKYSFSELVYVTTL